MSRLLTYGILNQRFSSVDVLTGLLGCWEMDEASGNTSADATTGGRNLTGINTPTYGVTGKISNAVEYNGINEYSRWPSASGIGSSYFSPTQVLSVSVWFKRLGNSVDTTEAIVSRYFASNGYRNYIIDINRTTKNLRWMYQDNTNTFGQIEYIPGSDIWTGNWYHVVATRNGASMKLYVNGVLEASGSRGTGTATVLDSSSNVYFNIGNVSRSSTTPDLYFYGVIDQTAVWNIELDQDQVDFLYNAGAGRAYSSW